MQATKAEVRTAILSARRGVATDVRRAESDALRAYVAKLAQPGTTMCAYVPVGSEPGSPAMLDALLVAGAKVLLPVARDDEHGRPMPLSWGEFRGELVAAPFGLREPPPPWLPAAAIGAATAVIVPALAVDRAGVRLGRGAGFYDRSLTLADPAAWLIAVVRDDEIVDHLPGESHDVPMTHALTPGQGLIALGAAR
ncbi:5-formyltetrahydrofolate cyclo-ligase [Mycobacterium antarcticum]|uniref:5-formyltetrahydrofolate cyclo-ligase n=1 Tax=Mycolicibacterium sp. TUM20983 TaxID=3023369 RepID=UPI0023837010|nr:5-formyltetrahydrofolate cyclo-ligase [Mycolicibacterium sp. TUM20983]GLP73930.1 5-formyltetrahydrofolate cyclo-ligase [Mycolicibacterium sp. TUM20983]